jgi:hypothetical protein
VTGVLSNSAYKIRAGYTGTESYADWMPPGHCCVDLDMKQIDQHLDYCFYEYDPDLTWYHHWRYRNLGIYNAWLHIAREALRDFDFNTTRNVNEDETR